MRCLCYPFGIKCEWYVCNKLGGLLNILKFLNVFPVKGSKVLTKLK
jgi:hypothetical protein